jgi:hypothetical protein
MGKIRETMAKLEAEGLVVRNGEMRPNRRGELEPVYVLTAKGMVEVAKLQRGNNPEDEEITNGR